MANPWGAAAAGAPVPDPMWGLHGDHLERLSFMPALPPGPAPDGVTLADFGNAPEYLQALRAYSIQKVDPELLQDRQDLWRTVPGDHKERWMYLQAETREAHENFHGWIKTIKDDLNCDERSCSAFVRLFKMAPPKAPHGYFEAARILAHMLKDKSKNAQDWRPERTDWSRFLQKACEEAIEALEDPENLRELKNMHSGKGFGTYSAGPPGHHPGSGSSSSWAPPTGHGYKGPGGKDYGKGKVLQKGFR
jgi:hypothetical protein